MFAALRRRATYANVVATIGLILAVGGGSAYALQGRNTVFSNDIAPDAVKGADAKEASFKTPRVYEVTIGAASMAAGDQLAAYADCPAGYSVTGGGFDKSDANIKIKHSHPYTHQTDYSSWVVLAEATDGGQTVTAHVVCERGTTTLLP